MHQDYSSFQNTLGLDVVNVLACQDGKWPDAANRADIPMRVNIVVAVNICLKKPLET
jgi:hypothetical protein